MQRITDSRAEDKDGSVVAGSTLNRAIQSIALSLVTTIPRW